jgi:hypothetical protein
MEDAVGEGIPGAGVLEEASGPVIRAPDYNPFYNYAESVNPLFDPRRFLLRRTFFINEDCSKYLSVGYYPARDYLPLVEVGASSKMPVRLEEEHVRTFAEHLPRICEAMCGDEQYTCVDGEFTLQTTGTYHVARVYDGKKYISLHLTELRYMMYMFRVVHNQQIIYFRALSDVINYARAAQQSSVYVEPATSASKSILYPKLYEELKTIM